jgi:hypothetical protein
MSSPFPLLLLFLFHGLFVQTLTQKSIGSKTVFLIRKKRITTTRRNKRKVLV